MNEESIKQLEDLFEVHKQDFLRVIFTSELSKTEKLILIQKHNLLPVSGWIEHPFHKQELELQKAVMLQSGRTYCITDDFFRYTDRHDTIYFGDVVKDLKESVEDTDYEYTEVITIVTNRTNSDVISVTINEFIDIIYDFVVEKQIIGFKMDW